MDQLVSVVRSNSVVDPAFISSFKSWLQNKNYSDATIRNYLVDLGKYLNYINQLPQTISLNPNPEFVKGHILSTDIISLYVSYLSGKTNAPRYLASLNQFCQFAIDQGLISHNPLRSVRADSHIRSSSPSLESLVTLYQQHLIKHNSSPFTVKNYINDLNQYISWLEIQNPPAFQAPSLEKGGLIQNNDNKITNFILRLPFFKGRSRRERSFETRN